MSAIVIVFVLAALISVYAFLPEQKETTTVVGSSTITQIRDKLRDVV